MDSFELKLRMCLAVRWLEVECKRMNRRIEQTNFIALLFVVELLEPIHRAEIIIQ